jgi:hypothetical protein
MHRSQSYDSELQRRHCFKLQAQQLLAWSFLTVDIYSCLFKHCSLRTAIPVKPRTEPKFWQERIWIKRRRPSLRLSIVWKPPTLVALQGRRESPGGLNLFWSLRPRKAECTCHDPCTTPPQKNVAFYQLSVFVFGLESALVVARPREDGQPRHVTDGGQSLAPKSVRRDVGLRRDLQQVLEK